MGQRSTFRTFVENGCGYVCVWLVKRGVLDRIVGAADRYLPADPVIYVSISEEETEYEEAVDPIEEMDGTEIVQVVRRPGEIEVGVDYQELDLDIALAIMTRGLFQLLLEDILVLDEEDDD